jgi:uncharacterized protein YdiU (UPF0061 family)
MNIPRTNALHRLAFDNASLRSLPIDPETRNERRQIRNAVHAMVRPTPCPAPARIAHAREVAAMFGLDQGACESDLFAEVFTGNFPLPGMEPHATCYGGHQFGSWAGQLGDGRAINLGEAVTVDGSLQMLQLKGAGETPFSRTADGLAVLRSSVREFLCSEAMHHLGIPTTRALSLCLTGRGVWRDMFYDGNPEEEPGAVVCRVAPSFLRFGHFEILAARRETALLKQLADFTIRSYFPESAAIADDRERYLHWFTEVCDRTAALVVDWMRTGFVHGVMNTDNMSILGLTIDYGPYGWLDSYDPEWTPNTSDSGSRYCYRNQPPIAQWNLIQLANAILPLIGEAAPLENCLQGFAGQYTRRAEAMTAAKLGLKAYDEPLTSALFGFLGTFETDMTLFYRGLADLTPGDMRANALIDVLYNPDTDVLESLQVWLDQYAAVLKNQNVDDDARVTLMNRTNPAFILRNFLAQEAIDAAATGDFSGIHALLEASRHPYDRLPEHSPFNRKRPDWARSKPGCSQLSCSS